MAIVGALITELTEALGAEWEATSIDELAELAADDPHALIDLIQHDARNLLYLVNSSAGGEE